MKDARYWETIQAQEQAEEEARWADKCRLEKQLTAEQRIYKSIKMKGRIRKAHGKWVIGYAHLFCAIKENGYSAEQTRKIITGMEQKGYVRKARGTYGRPSPFGNYVIEKWVN